MPAACARLPSTTRLLLVHGDADATVPPASLAAFDGETGHVAKKRVVRVPGADHNFTSPAAAAALVDELVAWVVVAVEAGGGEEGGG